jgi:hypothetical protein
MRDVDAEYLIRARILVENRIAPEGVVSEAEIGPKSELTELSGRRLSFDNLSHELEELAARCVVGQRRLAFLGRGTQRANAEKNGKCNDDRTSLGTPPMKITKHDRFPLK